MRYRREDADGDYTFGSGDDTWLINSPEAVAQAIKRDSNCGMANGSSIRRQERRGSNPCSASKSRKPTIWRSANASSKRGV